MRKFVFLILGLLATAAIGQAQDIVITNAGWFDMSSLTSLATTNYTTDDSTQMVQVLVNFQPMTPPTPPIIAEVVTPEIQALADGLQDDPLKIYNYVHDHIRFTLYFGSKKGAQLTLLEKSGNDFDQCALLVALLRAAGYSNAGYQFGWMLMPYDNPDGSHRDLHHWLGLSLTNSTSTWSTTAGYLDSLFRVWGNYPIDESGFDANTFAFQRVWVTLTAGGTNYLLDPAFKVSEPVPGINLQSAMGFSSNTVTTAAAGTDTANYVTNLNEANLRGTLAGYTTNILNYIQSNYPNASVAQILGGQSIVPSTNAFLSQMYFAPTNLYGTMPVTTWVNEPTNLMSTFAVTLVSTKYQCFMPQLQGQRLSLTISSTGSAQLWLDDSNVASASTGGGSGVFYPTLSAYQPHGSWNITSNLFIPGTVGQTVNSKSYKAASASYAILYAFDPDWGWLQERQKKLDAYRQQGLSDTSRQVVTETLNIMGLNWQLQVQNMSQMLAQQIGVLPRFNHRIGRMSQESGAGYYVDVYMELISSFSSSTTSDDHESRWFDLYFYFASAMEHGLIEQLQSTSLVGASTIKILQLANTNHQAIYLVSSTNWSAVQGKFVNYNTNDLASQINGGYTLLLPQNGSTEINGVGSWTGYGILERSTTGGGTQMIIGNGEFGGYVSDPNATVDSSYINSVSYSEPLYFSSAPVSVPNITGADPVNMADGTFQVQATDLVLGQVEPRGLSFSRYYSSSRRNSNLAGIAPGWIHNYYLKAATVSSPQASLGGTTPAQTASMLVATVAAVAFYNGAQPDPKNWMVTALTAKWAIDQITGKAMSVSLGKDTLQFIKEPDGSYTPPANCAMTLTQNGSAYSLQERHGRTFKFNSAGWATNIVDQYGQTLRLAYNSSNWVTTVTDWTNRTLTFNYSTTSPKQLISVVDSAGRTIGLSYSSGGDLISVTDPESKTSTFLYDTNHQITATFNAASQLVASNFFNGFGRVTTQYTDGDPNKAWRIFWSGWQTVSQDPAGGQQSYFYDDKTRLIGQQDALTNLSQKFYDGQDHVVMTISPLGETNQFIYDGSNNLVEMIDPLGFSNQFFYDNQDNLVRALDPLGNPSTFGYNSSFSLTGKTNGANDWLNYSYNGNGTLASRTDSGGMTSYGYDSYGQLNSIVYPGSLGSESFANSSLGDVTSHTDARNFATSFQYNLRRQLTNSVAPTNLMVKLAYDAVGNQLSATDARGNTASNIWSATRKLLAVKLPATSQGTAVITNTYDNRDWLTQTLDPLQKATQFADDMAGHLIASTDPLSRTNTFGYDADGHCIAATNAAQEVTRQTWDARGKLVQLTDGAQHTSLRGYDAAGNQIILTNRNGNGWQFKFDGANRLTNTLTPLGRSTSLAFNHQGLPVSIKDSASQITSLNYDAMGRLTNRTDNVATNIFAYDANNNLTNISETINSQTSTNSYAYDAYNRVSSYQDAQGNLISYRYDANGNVTNLVYPGGRTVAYFYDSLNRLTNVTDWAQHKTSVTFDLNSHVTRIARPNGSYRTMNYDSAGQLTNILEQMANTLPIAIFKFNWTNSGNMAWEFAAPLPHSVTVPTRTMTYDPDNRLATFQLGTSSALTVGSDADGNLTNAPLMTNLLVTYAYDARNRLLNAGGVTNTYDPTGNRVGITSGTNTTIFVVNPNAALPQVLMRIKNGVTNYYVYGGAGLLYQVTETATATNTLTYHYDYRGSTIALSGDNGLVTDRIEYSAYGLTTYRAGTTDTPFLFNGKYGVQTDPNGLLNMRARYYNPFLCRFISADPSGFAGGLNHYAYANGNPVSYLDPFGLGAVGESSVDLSWFNAPTPEQTEVQNVLADFVNFVTLGGANLVSAEMTGTDLQGNNLNVADAYEQTLDAGAFVASLALSLPTDGGSVEVEEAVLGSDSVAADGEGALAGVNPTGNMQNCINCTIAGDATLAGSPASALPTLPGMSRTIDVLENIYGGAFQPVSGQIQVGSILSQSGNGSRGIVFGESLTSGQPGHVFSAFNNNGSIQFIDFQTGGSGLNNFNNFRNFRFLLTSP